MDRIRLLVVDNSAIFRRGLRLSLARLDDVEVVGDCGINDDVLQLMEKLCPDTALIDIGLPQLSGLQQAQQISRRFPAVSIIALASYDTDKYLFQAVKAGAVGYLSKDAAPEEIASAVRRIHAGERLVVEAILARPELVENMLQQLGGLPDGNHSSASTTAPLTRRELEILNFVARGHVNKSVARELGISEQTIKNHMSSILRKLDANDRTQAVVMAIRNGWISSEESWSAQSVAHHNTVFNALRNRTADSREGLRALLNMGMPASNYGGNA